MNDDEYNSENPFGLETESSFHEIRKTTTLKIMKDFAAGKKSPRLLDVGCGIGRITKYIYQNFNASIDAIDISEKAIELAKEDKKSINFIHTDAMDFDGFGYLYDFIVLNNIYEHVENPVGLLKKIKKILKPEGVIILSTPNRYFIRNIFRKLFGLKILIPRYHITEYSIGQLYDHHNYVGLSIKKIVIPKFKREHFTIMHFIMYGFFQPILDLYLKLLSSETRTGSLLFVISSIKK